MGERPWVETPGAFFLEKKIPKALVGTKIVRTFRTS